MRVTIIRTTGVEEEHDVPYSDLTKLLDARYLFIVDLRDGRVMYGDDEGYVSIPVQHSSSFVELVCGEARKLYNKKATTLYHSICKEGTTHRIVGDVAICKQVEDTTCKACEGRGVVGAYEPDPDVHGARSIEVQCPVCRGGRLQ